ncbi:MAG: hypothetical protein RLZZ69_967, partial [Cyanobacteriota bacterium]
MQMQQMGLDVRQLFNSHNIPMLRDNARPEAISNLQKSLILEEIARKEDLKPAQSEIDAKIAEIRPQLAGQEVDEERLLEMVTSDLLTENTYKFLRDKAQIELVPEGSLQETPEELEQDSETEIETIEAEVVADSE